MEKKFNFSIILILSCLMLIACTTKPKLIDPIVQVQSGKVQGVANESGTVMMFKGIPYAAPPVGDLRWREPQPAIPWDGILDASEFCESCIQNRVYSHIRTGTGPWTEEFMVQNDISEDCLFLNIWTPAEKSSDKLAVFVYIHGGGLTEGSGAIDVYDGEELSKKGVIVVTINYRLGVLGFLAHPELTAESPHNVSGNYGYLDQVAALKWIQSNIESFGGDPGRVTIAGQSAGAGSVNALTISPLASGLFHRAITQSGTGYGSTNMGGANTLVEAEKRGLEFAKLKGASSIAELRAMSPEDIISTDPAQTPVRFGGIIDGYFHTSDRMTIFASGKQNDTPFMTGMNRDELRYSGEKSPEYFNLYLTSAGGDSALAEKTAAQEQSRLNSYLWIEFRAKTSNYKGYIYYFEQAIPWPEHPEFGAFHTGEVPYVFNNLKMLDRPWTETDSLVADMMSSYWVNFTKNGDPNGEGLPVWNPTDSNNKTVMRFGKDIGLIPVAASEERFNFLQDQILSR